MDADRAEIEQGLQALCAPGQVYELRVLDTHVRTVSGYYDDLQLLARAAEQWSGKGSGVYITANPCRPELLARAANRAREYARHATGDEEILCRRWLLVDFDSRRPAGISASDAEREAALAAARACSEWLENEGWPRPYLADSGNGAHLCVRLDEPADEATRDLVRQALRALAARYDSAAVSVDQATYNAARIWKLPGTLARKGDPVPGRPHRLARVLQLPAPEPAPRALLERLAALGVPPAIPRPTARVNGKSADNGAGDYATLDVVAWATAHGAYGRPLGGGKHAILCPWIEEHTEKRPAEHSDTVLYEPDGARGWPSFACKHAHCRDRGFEQLLAVWSDAARYCAREWQAPAPGLRFPVGLLAGREGGSPAARLEEEREMVLHRPSVPWIESLEPLRIVETDPPTYYVRLAGKEIELTDTEFMEWRAFRRACVNRLGVMPILPQWSFRGGKKMTPQQVLDILIEDALKTAVRDPAPPDAGEGGACWDAVRSFLRRKLVDAGDRPADDVAEGRVVQIGEEFHFRGEVLRRWLGREYAGTIRPDELWRVMRRHGGRPSAVKSQGKRIRCWVMPVSAVDEPEWTSPSGGYTDTPGTPGCTPF